MKTIVWEKKRHHLVKREVLRHIVKDAPSKTTVCGLGIDKAEGKPVKVKTKKQQPNCPRCISMSKEAK